MEYCYSDLIRLIVACCDIVQDITGQSVQNICVSAIVCASAGIGCVVHSLKHTLSTRFDAHRRKQSVMCLICMHPVKSAYVCISLAFL